MTIPPLIYCSLMEILVLIQLPPYCEPVSKVIQEEVAGQISAEQRLRDLTFRLIPPWRHDVTILAWRPLADKQTKNSPSCNTPDTLWSSERWACCQHPHGSCQQLGSAIRNLHSALYLCQHNSLSPWTLRLSTVPSRTREFLPTLSSEWQYFSSRPFAPSS